MTDTEASNIEEAFSLRIPPVWRSLITDSAWCERFSMTGLLTDYDDMRRENQLYRDSEYVRDYWRPEWLAIHADGCGNVYFLDTLHPNAVYELDHEKTFPGYDPLEREVFPSVEAFIAHVEEYEFED
jgi:cell wall assembly regulator SMI1